jgi:hypothetical protein
MHFAIPTIEAEPMYPEMAFQFCANPQRERCAVRPYSTAAVVPPEIGTLLDLLLQHQPAVRAGRRVELLLRAASFLRLKDLAASPNA